MVAGWLAAGRGVLAGWVAAGRGVLAGWVAAGLEAAGWDGAALGRTD